MSDAELLWQPSAERAARSNLAGFMSRMAARHGFTPEWPSMHRWSVERSAAFWGEMLEYTGLAAATPPSAVRTGEGMLGSRWFPGLTFNFAGHLLRHNDDRVAIEAEDERGRRRSITYRELTDLAARLAASLRAAGVGKGDRVGAFTPNIPEAVIGMLATTSIGAIWSSCSPDFGESGVFDRFGQIAPKVLIAADGYTYNGKPVDVRDRIAGIVERIPAIEHTVVVPFLSDAPDIAGLRNATLWHDFLAPQAAPVYEPLPFDHPLYIMYSSGTTGVPKCIVHGAGGTLLQHVKELALHTDLGRDDVIMYFTTCGWMMWNWLVSSLAVGATVVLYEGSPTHPDIHHLWQLAERTGMTVFGTSPRYLSACQQASIEPMSQHNLAALRAVLSTGSPLTIENFRWVYSHVKRDVQLSSISGGTDIISCFMLGNPMLPVYAGEIQCLGLGMNVQALDDDGRPVIGRRGELVCATPFPSQPVGFWNDPDGEKYRKAYFDHYPGIWRHGDFVEITERGGVIVYGRSDATLNPGGVRIGTAEIYRQVEAIAEVRDSVVVAKRTPDGDEEICLFVVLGEGLTLDEALTERIKSRIAAGTTRRHVPKHIRQVTAIPYTISNKKVEIAVTRMIHGEPVPNRDALANPDALEQYRGIV
jgi:acetoacetyl-CoA synthetase